MVNSNFMGWILVIKAIVLNVKMYLDPLNFRLSLNSNIHDAQLTILCPMSTIHYLELLVAVSWHGGRVGVAIRAMRGCRGQGRMLRTGCDYYLAAVPGMMVSVTDTAC